MKHDFYYIIRPTTILSDLLDQYTKNHHTQLEASLRNAVIWQKQPGRTFVGWEAEHAAQVKLLFLADWIETYHETTEPSFKALLGEILGEPPYSVDLFNRWWTLEVVRSSLRQVTHEAQALSPHTYTQFAPTGLPEVDEWLASQRSQKSGQST
jgi:hypothetical protein